MQPEGDATAEWDLLRGLLRQYNEQPDRRADLRAEIERRFAHPRAILAVDTCGFTRLVQGMGIVHFLALRERLERLARPHVARAGGRILYVRADNLYAVFPTAPAALESALAFLRDLVVVNEQLPAAEELYVSIGVGYGPVLEVGAGDVYGDEMNLACKLGEDLAERGEILLTPAARAALGDHAWTFDALEFRISGLALTAHRLRQE